jgi:hypothetical protein
MDNVLRNRQGIANFCRASPSPNQIVLAEITRLRQNIGATIVYDPDKFNPRQHIFIKKMKKSLLNDVN